MTSTLIAKLPGNFRYSNASGAEQDMFHALVAQLIGEEKTRGMAATQELDALITAAAAGPVKGWLGDVRKALDRMENADAFLAAHAEADIDGDVERSEKALAKADAKLADAQAARDQAAAEHRSAEVLRRRWQDATETMDPADPVFRVAWSHRKGL